MRPICASCSTFMRCAKNGVPVEVLSDGEPYQLWHGDRYACPKCKHEVIAGFPRLPISESYRPEYTGVVSREEQYGPIVRVEG